MKLLRRRPSLARCIQTGGPILCHGLLDRITAEAQEADDMVEVAWRMIRTYRCGNCDRPVGDHPNVSRADFDPFAEVEQ
jgi:hypothetical protein